MVREILQIGDKRLNTKSDPVTKEELTSREIKDLIQDLIDTCNDDAATTAGLSAVQLGVMKRVYVIRRLDLEKEGAEQPTWEVVINPEVKVIDKKKHTAWEGCMSVGIDDNRLFGPVTRPRKVEVTFTTPAGEKKTLTASNYYGHIFQHEQDHLDGVLFLKYITNPKNIWRSVELDKYLQEHDSYPHVVS